MTEKKYGYIALWDVNTEHYGPRIYFEISEDGLRTAKFDSRYRHGTRVVVFDPETREEESRLIRDFIDDTYREGVSGKNVFELANTLKSRLIEVSKQLL